MKIIPAWTLDYNNINIDVNTSLNTDTDCRTFE